ncbi:MAG: SMC-Scp complex subunit ScpB [Candidatus Kerfeldbacteria bacterium]|nr:SMC-Scp complex subunit ScpB [Candidatus Kerfeldbacteria bacterium]
MTDSPDRQPSATGSPLRTPSAALRAQIEALLFVATHPLSDRKLAELTGVPVDAVRAELDGIAAELANDVRGLQLSVHNHQVELVTKKPFAGLVQRYVTDERTGDLTKPSLETLTIIAYRGPVAKSELELIRGVNCSLILRNLMMRGLVSTVGTVRGEVRYHVTFDFLHHLGLSRVEDLPDYDTLHSHEHLERLLHPEIVPAASPEDDTDAVAVAEGTES